MNSGLRTLFLKRMAQLADRAGLEIRLVDYPPCRSEDYRIERRRSSPEKMWNGVSRNSLEVVLRCTLRRTGKGRI